MGRYCQHCKEWHEDVDYTSTRGRICLPCQRERNRAKHARYRKTKPEYNQKHNVISARWKKTPKGRAWRNAYQIAWYKTPKGLAALAKFKAEHPDYQQQYYAKAKIRKLLLAFDWVVSQWPDFNTSMNEGD